ncbi:MAG: ankyrin repeat domain-containing protein, partial [Gammaproteobacteria bacterium]
YQHLEISKLLLNKGFNPNCLTKDLQQTPLHIAVIKQNIAIIKLLLNNNADPKLIDIYGCSPINLAYDSNNKQIIDVFENVKNNNHHQGYDLCLLKSFQDSFRGKSNIQNTIDFSDNNIEHHALLKALNKKFILTI